jgi:anti-anti-sigma factor
MKITKKIDGATYLMKIEGAIVGSYALDLDQVIRSTNFSYLGIKSLVFDFTKVSMIDSIGLEAIRHAQEQGLRVSILNPRELVKDMLERTRFNDRLLPLLQIVEKDHRISARKEIPISTGFPVSC